MIRTADFFKTCYLCCAARTSANATATVALTFLACQPINKVSHRTSTNIQTTKPFVHLQLLGLLSIEFCSSLMCGQMLPQCCHFFCIYPLLVHVRYFADVFFSPPTYIRHQCVWAAGAWFCLDPQVESPGTWSLKHPGPKSQAFIAVCATSLAIGNGLWITDQLHLTEMRDLAGEAILSRSFCSTTIGIQGHSRVVPTRFCAWRYANLLKSSVPAARQVEINHQKFKEVRGAAVPTTKRPWNGHGFLCSGGAGVMESSFFRSVRWES